MNMTELKAHWESGTLAETGFDPWGWGWGDGFRTDIHAYGSLSKVPEIGEKPMLNNVGKEEIVHNLLDLCKHPISSRYIQDDVIFIHSEDTQKVFKLITKYAVELSLNQYGNFIIQKFLAPPPDAEERFGVNFKEVLVKKLIPDFWELTENSHGCRILQKCLEAAQDNTRLREMIKTAFMDEEGDLSKLIDEKSGNHVIQKLLDVFAPPDFQFLIDFLCVDSDQLREFCEKKFGCRVVQKTLQKANMEQKSQLVEKLTPHIADLARDEFGNYVVTEMIAVACPADRRRVIAQFESHLTSMAQNRYASHVLEAAFVHGDDEQKSCMINSIITATYLSGPAHGIEGRRTAIAVLMKDSFGNYVVQKMLLHAPYKDRKKLYHAVREAVPIIQKYRWGKQMLTRIEKALGSPLTPTQYQQYAGQRTYRIR